ncbi:unnamed protein product [Euphydryas editha]|uniref:Uncharacterized protein n=1 Tax=Euphydryas editha TaxID=104508 RepID=A0AAU9TG43_EUPED|nr:unnamed protein product [Euphydryas editha]
MNFSENQKEQFLERTKKTAISFGNTLRKIKDTTHEFGKNIYDHLNLGFKSLTNKSNINEDDIRQYEQLVIMKKYPYLDIHELDMKYFPIDSKKERNSDRLYLDRETQHEASFSDFGEDKINVEITNRGLSGFVIPPHLTKHGMLESKSAIKQADIPGFALSKKSPNSNVLRSLTKDINDYFDKKNVHVL